ncbi:MAG: serine/threonine protein kinase, partial [Xanthomonadales bacterium]|nr:serine/threonine protein kinase [Xanthomonadales bacterium]
PTRGVVLGGLRGGMAPDGRPYFVLEYVDGLPITQYCDQHQLRVVERLRLFLQVCRAVSHAHQRLVVHRDLKPSNILVTSERMVQLLDFGIAKLLHPDLLGLGELARPEDQAMTPRYAAPEQILNEPITTATDIYALGVLLYELLTGDLPYSVKDQAGHALERAILEQEPRRPGDTLTDPSNLRAAAQASQRGVDLSELGQQLSGDLETVLLKALRKSPSERYPSVEALAKDLEAYLDGMPVSAQPDSWRYRVGKFVGRHRTAVAIGAMAAFGLLLGVVYLWQGTQLAQAQASRSARISHQLARWLLEQTPSCVTVARINTLLEGSTDSTGADQLSSLPTLEAEFELRCPDLSEPQP